MIIPRYQLVCRLAGNDGNCQFRSVSLCKYGTESLHLKLRALVAIEMKNRGEFYNKFKCHGERDISKPGTWGGEATLVALARVTRSKVVVYQGWKVIFTYNGGNSGDIYLDFTGNHYNSLIKKKTSYLNKEEDNVNVKYGQNGQFEKPKKTFRVKSDTKICELLTYNRWACLKIQPNYDDNYVEEIETLNLIPSTSTR